MESLKDLKKRGSGILVVFVEGGKVSESHVTFSDEHPEDLTLTKNTIRAALKLGVHELLSKDAFRIGLTVKEREGQKK